MSTVWITILTLATGALLSGVATYIGTRHKLALDYDADLRQKRIVAYQDLWRRLGPLAKYGHTASLSAQGVDELAEDLRDWYFGTGGGLFLSTSAREDYFALQSLLQLVADGWGWDQDAKGTMTPATREHVRTYGSRLRTSLTRDVATRTRPTMRGDVDPLDTSVAGTYVRDGDGRRLRLSFQRRLRGGTGRIVLTALDDGRETPIEVRAWSRDRLTITAELVDPAGTLADRVLLLEGGRIVEGPPLEAESPAPPALWRRPETG